METSQNIRHILEKISVISKKYNDIAKITGENFNLFSIMGMETNERYTHSAIIGELLNTEGSHKQGSIFLKLFFNEIEKLKDIQDFNFENTKITLEKYIGKVNVTQKSGGFIDIVIEDGKNTIVIENKIYAGDQEAQLERYKNYYKDSRLFYLNLFGDEPSKESKGMLELDKDFYVITYKNHIKNWLEKCHKEAIEQPILRESIKQYLNLIKKLTNQTINNEMSQEITDLILKDLKSAKEIADNFQKAKKIILNNIRTGLKKELENIYGADYYFFENHNNAEEKNSHIWFSLKDFKEEKQTFCFGLEPFSGLSDIQSGLFIGILDFGAKNQILFKEYAQEIKINGWWRGIETIGLFEGHHIDFSNIDFLQFLHNNPNKLNELFQFIVEKVGAYICSYEKVFIEIHKKRIEKID